MRARVRWCRRPPFGHRVPRVDDDVGDARRWLHRVVKGHARKVVNVYLHVSWLGVPGVRRQLPSPLQLSAPRHPAQHRRGWWLRGVEVGVFVSHPRGDERRDALEPVGREGATEADAL
eukprot:5255784-Pleurochrysis_carterae.AAC.1